MEYIGIIPCAGKGSRLGLPFSKEMFPDVYSENYRPIIMYTIDAMKIAGIKHVVITVNPDKADIIKYLGNGSKFGMTFTYCVHPEPRSLPESINEAYLLCKNKTVVFAMPDTCITPNDFLSTLLEKHEEDKNKTVTLGCFTTKTPNKFGMVDVEGNFIKEIIDKPKKTNLKWMWGTMIWEPEFTEILNEFVNLKVASEQELIFSDSLSNLIINKKVGYYFFEKGIYRDLGTFDEIKRWLNIK